MLNQSDPLDRTFQALADPTRRAILGQLMSGPASVSDLSAPFAMSLPAFLGHIRALEASGLIHTRKSGRIRICEADPERLAQARQWIDAQQRIWNARLDRLSAYLDAQAEQDQP